MDVNPDFRDLFKVLNACRVRYIVVGAHAVVYYTEPRYTKDLDIWVDPSPENASRVFRALAEFGAPLKGITEQDLTNPDMIYQIGVEPNRIDFMMDIEGIELTPALHISARLGGWTELETVQQTQEPPTKPVVGIECECQYALWASQPAGAVEQGLAQGVEFLEGI